MSLEQGLFLTQNKQGGPISRGAQSGILGIHIEPAPHGFMFASPGVAEDRSRIKLGRKMEQAIIALLTCRNTEEAAKSVGVSSKTLLQWQKLPEVEKAFSCAIRDSPR